MHISIQGLLAGLIASLGVCASAQTGDDPNTTITLVVPFAAGSGTNRVCALCAAGDAQPACG